MRRGIREIHEAAGAVGSGSDAAAPTAIGIVSARTFLRATPVGHDSSDGTDVG